MSHKKIPNIDVLPKTLRRSLKWANHRPCNRQETEANVQKSRMIKRQKHLFTVLERGVNNQRALKAGGVTIGSFSSLFPCPGLISYSHLK